VPGPAVAVDVDQPGQQQPVRRGGRELPGPRRGGAGVRDPVADDGEHTVVDDRAAGDQPAPQDGARDVGQDRDRSSTVLVGATVPGVAAGATASSVLPTAASASSSRPGVLRFHLRITNRNST
jgi:hypothetical protein